MYGSNHPGLRFAKPAAAVLNRRALVLERERNLREMCRIVRKRDGGLCRACSKPGRRVAGSQVHHLVFRSQGGKHDARNGVLLCKTCHQDIHAKVLRPVFSASNPARTVKFERCG